MVYKITCLTCQSQGKSKLYWGESHRSGWDRSADHQAALKRKDETYAIVKHWLIDHPEGQPEFEYKVQRSFRSSLERQIMESILIDEEKPESRLNSRSEWGANKVPRLMIDPESQYDKKEGQNSTEEGPIPGQENEGQGQHEQVKINNNGKRHRSSTIQVNPVTVNPVENIMTRKKVKLNIIDHFSTIRK